MVFLHTAQEQATYSNSTCYEWTGSECITITYRHKATNQWDSYTESYYNAATILDYSVVSKEMSAKAADSTENNTKHAIL